MVKTNEEIKWDNAAELNHMMNQIELSKNDRVIISKFLHIANEDKYNEKLETLKKFLETVPHSKLFCDALNPLIRKETNEWKRYDPIEQTPLDHMLHGSYVRIPPKSKYDEFYGKPIPGIFFRGLSLLTSKESTIGRLQTIYFIIKPFDYDFPDIIEEDSMKFKLLEISNPKYVNLSHRDSKYRGHPIPIIKDGKIFPMMTDREYTEVYKKYRSRMKQL